MKKILSIGLIFIITNSVFADAFNVNLKYGMRGSEVSEMQEFLIDQGYLTGSATGNFYSVTLRAVKAFQKANNLSVSGFWGPLSRQKANEIIDLDASNKEEVENPVIQRATSTQTIYPVIQPVQSTITPVQTSIQNQTTFTAPLPDVYSLSIQQMTLDGNSRYTANATKNGVEIPVKKCWQYEPITNGRGDDLLVVPYYSNPNLKVIASMNIRSNWKTECELEDGKVLNN